MKHKSKSATGSSPAKGKGKGGVHGKGKDKSGSGSGSGSGETIDLKDCPLTLAEFATSEQNKMVPRYAAVLKRSEQDGIGLEDVDTLQLELEALLSATVVRKLTIKEETKILTNIERYRGQGKMHKKGPLSPGKRSLSKDPRSAKKFKPAGVGKPADGGKVIGIPKLKTDNGGPGFDPLQNEQIRPDKETTKPNLPKNETPNRFWAFVEPYCAPISQDDVKLIEDLIKSHGDMSEYFRVPKLGQHYTIRWANEDLEYERNKSAVNEGESDTNKNGESMVKKLEPGEKTPYGELTQRLVAGLIEDNLMTSVEDSIDPKKSEAEAESKAQLIKSLNVSNSEALEARVKKELQDQGILDPNDEGDGAAGGGAEHDEIYEELVRCQNELRAVSAHNLQQLKRLMKAAREEMGRQELRNKLSQADLEVMEAYKKVSAARSKKKALTKKEREQAWKALKEREIVLKQLESI